MVKTRYNSLIKRSFDLLLRYKIYDEIYIQKNDAFDLENFDVSNEIKRKFSGLYIKGERAILREVNKSTEKFKSENKAFLKKYEVNYKTYFEDRMPFEKFDEFWNPKNFRTCRYCGVNEDNIEKLKKQEKIQTKRFYSRGKTMEVDKIKADGEYEVENIILACYWCNNAKTDEYNLTEFKEIARGINAVWSKRLVELNENPIEFPETTYKKIKHVDKMKNDLKWSEDDVTLDKIALNENF